MRRREVFYELIKLYAIHTKEMSVLKFHTLIKFVINEFKLISFIEAPRRHQVYVAAAGDTASVVVLWESD